MNWDYDQSAVIANLMLQEPCSNIVAWQKFLPTGKFRFLVHYGDFVRAY